MMRKFAPVAIAALLILVAGCGTPEATPRQGQAGVVPAAVVTPNFCGGVDVTYPSYDIAQLTWTSRQIVAGTVIEQLPSTVVVAPQGTPTSGQRPDPIPRTPSEVISTEYVVQVEQRLRGMASPLIRVSRPGGTIGGCTQVYDSEPRLAVGDRLLLFLVGSPGQTTTTPYTINTGRQGVWVVHDDGTVTTQGPLLRPLSGQPLSQVEAQVQAVLRGQPPTTIPPILIVPLDEAPLPATPVAPRP